MGPWLRTCRAILVLAALALCLVAGRAAMVGLAWVGPQGPPQATTTFIADGAGGYEPLELGLVRTRPDLVRRQSFRAIMRGAIARGLIVPGPGQRFDPRAVSESHTEFVGPDWAAFGGEVGVLLLLCVGMAFAGRRGRGPGAGAAPPVTSGGDRTLLREGAHVGAYRIEELIGIGAMGVVYRAHHAGLDRPVAIKLLAPALAADGEIRARMRREALNAARLDHPSVVTVYDAGERGGRAYIAMQLVVGRSLDTLVGTPELTPARIVAVLGMVAAGLDHAHERHVVHRDVKPQNIIVEDATGRALLADFGIAAAAGQDRLTTAGDLVGTIAYAAPEQLAGAVPAAPVDVYSLGCVLFELLTGHLPFERRTLHAAIHAHRFAPAPAVSAHRRELAGSGIDAVVRRALAKDPRNRWPSAGAFAEAASTALAATGARAA